MGLLLTTLTASERRMCLAVVMVLHLMREGRLLSTLRYGPQQLTSALIEMISPILPGRLQHQSLS